MADSIREKVLKNIVTTLKGINGTGGFTNNLKNRVYRYSSPPAEIDGYPAIEIGEPNQDMHWVEAAADLIECALEIPLVAYMDADPITAGSVAASTRISEMIADVEKALYADIQRGTPPVAKNTLIISIQSETNRGVRPHEAIRFIVLVKTRYRALDPTTFQ